MIITKALKAELAQWLDTFWITYMKGDFDVWSTFIAENYYNIGGTKEEIWHSKKEILDYSYAIHDQMVDQAEVRNREIEVLPYGDYLMVNEFTDLYVKIEGEWTYYGPFRMSSLLSQTNTGWIALHQHGSYPDMKATEGEAFAADALKAENKRLQEAVEQRTAELKGKNQELEIEASLERVRTVAMGMKTPDDMLKVCRVIAYQLEVLGVKQIRNVQTAIIESKEEVYRCYQYFPGYDQDVIERTEYLKNPVEQQMVNQMLATRDSHFLGALTGEELTGFRMHRKEENHLADPLLEGVDELGYCFLSIGEGGLGLTLYNALDEQSLSLFKRFHQVFSLTYQRFRDLQKAEAQAREAEVELALERVRARTMAMHKSSKLAEASILLDEQVRSLGIQTWGCAFHIYAEDEAGDYEWFSSANGSLPFYKTPREKFFLDFYERGQRGEKFYVKEFAREECKAHYDYLKTIPIAGDSLKALEESGISLPTYQIDHVAFFKHGYILYITYEPVPDAYAIFQRFANVFEQTFTRFLDLEKAEAQTREAEIELALERVRSRSLAMHATSELQDVIHTVHQELIKLEIGIFGGSFIAINSEIEEELHCWGSGGTANTSDEVHIPYFDKPFYTNLVKGLKGGPAFFTEEFTQEEKKEFFTFLFTKEPWSNLKANEKNEILSSPGGYTRSCSVSLHTSIFIINQSGKKFSGEENDILKRFGKVFEQSYTRFLDLQKAETQAREAQIEAALEKIRSRTMGMQHSNELPDAAHVLFNEVRKLGIPAWSCGYNILSDDKKSSLCWMSSENEVQPSFRLPLTEHISLQPWYEAIIKGEVLFVYEQGGEDLVKHYRYLGELPELKSVFAQFDAAGISLPTFQVNHLAKFDQGFLLFITYERVPEAHAIFQRFTKVFNQTYTRFLDLQKAEARAKESQIETALERVRSRTMGMQQSDELGDVATVLFNEMNGLVSNLWTCGFVLCEENRKEDEWWLSMDTGFTRGFFLPNVGDFAHASLYEGWQKGEALRSVVLEGDALSEHYNWLVSLPIAKQLFDEMDEKGIERPTWQKLHAAYFKTGYLVIITAVPCAEEEIFKSFAQVFDLTYTRFLDLQQKEEQGKKLVEEKLRLERTLKDLQATQAQLIQSEKMASLGELTAGIAHEIQNPLNFVNNFSEVSSEMFDELMEEIEKGDMEEVKALSADIKENLIKINHHGKRADSIVKGMLEHSRSSSGEKTLTDINALADEFLRLSYHGLRAKDKSFNSDFKLELDPLVPKINIIGKDLGRVILNLVNNAFYAVHDKAKTTPQLSRNIGTGSKGGEGFEPS
ncbi:nuclear transport factor 2 family protein [Algoriphagus aquimarinus]|uniref:histidine kinase n=1 Tax=Algoriphagus aquimarinus TaxID=237018 RepID=A0A1I0W0M4_9BACT|nr:nuclear transport factor 2 family protein [Algoriphagus aquimarinus]SFA81887.1 His Kinase A (phospho-acceptor) domain-containing protein [Algoriphagus aquimarinus]